MSVMVLQGPLRKADLLSLAIYRRHAVWIAIEYSYKLGQKMNLNFVRTRLVFAETVTYVLFIDHLALTLST